MFRSEASRALLRSLNNRPSQASRHAFIAPLSGAQRASQLCTWSSRRPQQITFATRKPITTILRRQAQTWDKPNIKEEKELSKKPLEPHPELVSSTSSTHPVFGEVAEPNSKNDTNTMKGIRGEIETVKDTFSLKDVPRETFYIGLAGVLPYLGTSLSTVYLATEINSNVTHGTGYFMTQETAEYLLSILEPLQIGYGAVILSFLGAIHWGLEFASYGGTHGYKRFMIGVVAPAVAWPTLLLPATTALIAQFFAFNFLYYADTRATVRGWTPGWYGTYRFVLTLIVGASIILSLIGRGEISYDNKTVPNMNERAVRFKGDIATEELGEAEEAIDAKRQLESRAKGATGADEEEVQDEDEGKEEKDSEDSDGKEEHESADGGEKEKDKSDDEDKKEEDESEDGDGKDEKKGDDGDGKE